MGDETWDLLGIGQSSYILFRQRLWERIIVLSLDEEARFMCVSLQLSQTRMIHIALCYFPPKESRFATWQERGHDRAIEIGFSRSEESPYLALSETSLQYSTTWKSF